MPSLQIQRVIAELLELDVEDIALDFVEQEVGRFYFCDKWFPHKEAYIPLLRKFLENLEATDLEPEVLEYLDYLANQKARWNDFFLPSYDLPEKPKKK